MGLFVRRVKTASGATAVQVAQKSGGVRTIVKHVGSAHSEAELAVLLNSAREFIQGDQLAFDIDTLVPGPPVSAAPTVTHTQSRVLWEVLGEAYEQLGFAEVGDQAFRSLVLARIVEPTSKADTIRVLGELGVPSPSLRTIWRTLLRCVEQDWRHQVAKACYTFREQHGGLGLILYDVTTLYFEAEHEDELRKVGYSKERRVDPQVVVGLLVDSDGFPLEIHMFDGKKPETQTLTVVLDAFRNRHQVQDLIVVADAGMLSDTNLSALEDAGFGFIVGSRVSKAPKDLAGQCSFPGTVFTGGQIIEARTAMGRGGTHLRRVVYQFSTKRHARDNRTLDAQAERVRNMVAGSTRPKKARFVKQEGGEITLDEQALATARSLAGLKGYVTNIPAATLDGAGVIAAYHDLYQVERSFRMSKTDLRARPMFHHKQDSIEAHLTIVFAALAISRHLQEATGVSIRYLVRTLRPLRDVTISIAGQRMTAVTPPTPDAALIIETLRSNIKRASS